MRLIEKKCPNCGASLEFDENDKTCKCTYCKRGFEIERDTNDTNDYNLIYHKNNSVIFYVVAVIFVLIFIGFFTIQLVSYRDRVHEEGNSFSSTPLEKEKKLFTSADELTAEDISDIEHKCYSTINQSITGRNDTTYSYQKTGDPKIEKLYVVYKKDKNYLIPIYKVIYHNFFNQSDVQTVYVPVVFEDVYDESLLFHLEGAKNPAPEYYLNEDHSSYIYAYASFEDAYNNVIKPYESDFTITEK